MALSMIVAYDQNRGIGLYNALLWKRIPEDMARFREKTEGNIVVMGSKTFDSIGKPLPRRKNIILSKRPMWQFPKSVSVANRVKPIVRLAERMPDEEIFIIGGAELYRQFLPYTDTLYVTEVDAAFTADTHFPEILLSEWSVTLEHTVPPSRENPYELAFKTYRRVRRQA